MSIADRAAAKDFSVHRVADLARFTLGVQDVLEDAPHEAEGDVRITSGIRYGPVPVLEDARVQAVLVALRMG